MRNMWNIDAYSEDSGGKEEVKFRIRRSGQREWSGAFEADFDNRTTY